VFLEARSDGPEVRERAEDHSQRLHGGKEFRAIPGELLAQKAKFAQVAGHARRRGAL